MNAPPQARPGDVKSIDSIITAAYEVISGEAGEKRDWDRLRSLFAPGARMIPTSREAGVRIPDQQTPAPLSVESYISRVEEYFQHNGFYEVEVARRTEQFDRIAHAFSSYESRHSPQEPEPFMRGINSIQLYHDGRRWWIVTIYWQHEQSESPTGTYAKQTPPRQGHSFFCLPGGSAQTVRFTNRLISDMLRHGCNQTTFQLKGH